MNPADVNRREIVRYLGGKWEAADEQMLALIEDVLAEMFSRVSIIFTGETKTAI